MVMEERILGSEYTMEHIDDLYINKVVRMRRCQVPASGRDEPSTAELQQEGGMRLVWGRVQLGALGSRSEA